MSSLPCLKYDNDDEDNDDDDDGDDGMIKMTMTLTLTIQVYKAVQRQIFKASDFIFLDPWPSTAVPILPWPVSVIAFSFHQGV